MRTIEVSAERNYTIFVDAKWVEHFRNLCEGRTRVAVITSQAFTPDFSEVADIESDLHFMQIPDGEEGKSISTLINLWNWLGAAGFTRSDLVIGIGGGAVTDIAGYAAATWLRGIDWVAFPTSLAGMVDASVGGKTGINSDYGKNLIGAFHSPTAVVIDPSWLTSLPDRDLAAGMAEVIKCGFISDSQILNLCKDLNTSTLRNSQDVLLELIYRSVAVKASVVSADFKESFAREALNYGHTLGHAIEKFSKYQMRHGEAISIGLVFAAEIAHHRGFISSDILNLHRNLLLAFDLPIDFKRDAWQHLLPLLALDKKSRGNTVRFVILNGIGTTMRLEDLSSDELASAYERISL